MIELKLTYGLDINGRLIHVNDVVKGKDCLCTCPECGAQLIAKKGEKNQHHFAHVNGADCTGARMTALHRLAQQIIKDQKSVRLPRYEGMYAPAIESKVITFDDVILEKTIQSEYINRRPDCVGIKCDKYDHIHEIWIEIKVTHGIDPSKMQDVIANDITCIEIDLSDLLETNYTQDDIFELVITKPDKIRWINSPILDRNDQQYKNKKEATETERLQKSREIQAYIDEQQELEIKKRQELEIETQATRARSNNQIEPSQIIVAPQDVYHRLSDKEYFEAWEELNKRFNSIP